MCDRDGIIPEPTAHEDTMEPIALTQNPFAVFTFIAAPALLTNASCVLAMSTINRMLRTRDRMHELFKESENGNQKGDDAERLVDQVNRIERQALLLLRALHAIYVALGSFAAATLVTLLGAGLAAFQGATWFRWLLALGLLLGFLGLGGLVVGSANLFQATRISLVNIREEAMLIRERQAKRGKDAL